MSWLQSDSVAAQLAAQGYDPQKLLHQLWQLHAAREAAASSSSATWAEAKMAALVQQLQDVACSSVAAMVLGINPHCDNVTRDSEQRLVSGPICWVAVMVAVGSEVSEAVADVGRMWATALHCL